MSEYITTRANYTIDNKVRHFVNYTPQTEEERVNGTNDSRVQLDVKINNARENSTLKLDDASFELVNCSTSLSTSDFYKIQDGDNAIRQEYCEEIQVFVKRKTGCDMVVCTSSQVRNADQASLDKGSIRGYAIGELHTDFSPVTTDERAVQLLEKLGEDKEQYGRYASVNLWRNITDSPIENHHLAMLDERTTVKPDDYIPKDAIRDGYQFVQFGLNARHAETHQWYYFPGMTKNEGILLKNMDSDWTNSGRICFHMAVTDPTAPEDHKLRESIEVRMFCFWKKENCEIYSAPQS